MLRLPPSAVYMTKQEVFETIIRRDRRHRASDIYPLHSRTTTAAKSNAKSPTLRSGPQHCRDAALVHPCRNISLDSSPDPLSAVPGPYVFVNPENRPIDATSMAPRPLSRDESRNVSSSTKISSLASVSSDVDDWRDGTLDYRSGIQDVTEWSRSTSPAPPHFQRLASRRTLNRSSSDTVIATSYSREADGQATSRWSGQPFSTRTLLDSTYEEYLRAQNATHAPQTPILYLPAADIPATDDEPEVQHTRNLQLRRDMNASIEAANDRSSPLDTLAHSLIASLPMSWAQAASQDERGRNYSDPQTARRRSSVRSRTPSWATHESTHLMPELYPRRRIVSALQENDDPMDRFDAERRLFWARRQQASNTDTVINTTPPAAGRLGRHL